MEELGLLDCKIAIWHSQKVGVSGGSHSHCIVQLLYEVSICIFIKVSKFNKNSMNLKISRRANTVATIRYSLLLTSNPCWFRALDTFFECPPLLTLETACIICLSCQNGLGIESASFDRFWIKCSDWWKPGHMTMSSYRGDWEIFFWLSGEKQGF